MHLLLLAVTLSVQTDWVRLHEPSVIPKGWTEDNTSTVDKTVVFRVTIGMTRRSKEALQQTADEVSNPHHARFLQHLSYNDMAALVNPGKANIDEVKTWFKGTGPLTAHPHMDYLHGHATVLQLEEMVNGVFKVYLHETGAVLWRLTSGVHVPRRIADIIDVFTGFHGFPLNPSPRRKRKPLGPQSAGQVIPSILRKTYNVTDQPASGRPNLQAIVQFQGEYVSGADLSNFCVQYNNNKPCEISFYSGPNNDGKPGLESMTDTEYIMTVSNTATTWVYSYPNTDFCSDLLAFSSNATSSPVFPWVISISYGSQLIDFCTKSCMARFSQDMQKLAGLGISVIVSSGDDGSGGNTDQGTNNGKLTPSFPASSPYVTSVGSTFFTVGVQGEEEATIEFGSGGGFSWDFPMASWQEPLVKEYMKTVLKPGGGATWAPNGRGTPDISLLGESFTVLDGGNWYAEYGTSCSAPSFAGMVTQLNEVCLKKSGKSLGFLNSLLYQNPSAFTDITLGSNAIGYNTGAGWYAIKGWDAATGLGTPIFQKLVALVSKVCASR
eukprot:TRINITY_DN27339_c0_g1_i1.p1 TRINITY_DN27339_c0_g1~~TRINITY_DN27339_c0_g1_i1.p1  ORF type:complete len:551 (+),score=48.04 TRINITY_DN27339_c0_g1_i1:57-1709(+)